jgi:hypothetical protein
MKLDEMDEKWMKWMKWMKNGFWILGCYYSPLYVLGFK